VLFVHTAFNGHKLPTTTTIGGFAEEEEEERKGRKEKKKKKKLGPSFRSALKEEMKATPLLHLFTTLLLAVRDTLRLTLFTYPTWREGIDQILIVCCT